MRRTIMLVAAALFAVGMAAQVWAAESREEKDTAKLIGTWNVTAEERDGKKTAADGLKDRQVKITRDTITCTDKDGKTEMAAKYEIDTSKTPWQATLSCTEGEHKDKKVIAIVKLDGDKLMICHAKPEKEAPTEFKGGEGQCCLTLERGK
jgi:uncharacterized protein (TIGR03067 family)